ncbi:MAG: hydroxyacid dehydrogenase [Anaerolineae bacterium]|jgi:D-3-phosphoglycerate dehydrogenase|nr:hydroxyacid dehydrogenase [Anaerolineae bacterium]MBT4310628.1 hydroxyacid dehydrogenase [Anaerolineae bacterium]MBT4456943.1 hydroxyacid dehydrogenase [Anaerolineae bacterium]MBT4840893.1 hydroxyacid dehydrogenase [Anaerolineae bacterium]MBT6060339.1 hydroxyacid dehydrogenase [Anaerolineae bacterium]
MKILIANPIAPKTMKDLQNKHEVICAFGRKKAILQERIEGCEILVFRSGVQMSAELMDRLPDLKLLIRAGSGIDNLDIEYVQRRGLELIRIPEPGAKAVAEMTFALMLALSRNLFEADNSMRRGEWAKHKLGGHLLTGKVLGIIGAGSIGSRVGRLGAAWDMEVIAYDMNTSSTFTAKLADEDIRLTSFDEVITTADFVSLHVPLDSSTYYLISASALSRMKSGAILINIARGGVVDEQALYKALTEENRLRGAALDVHEQEGEGKLSPLAELPNVILTPHIGAMTIDSQQEVGCRIKEIISSYDAEQM